MNYKRFILGIFAQLAFLCTFAQATRKHLESQDYGQWGKLGMIKFSPDANYALYTIKDGSGKQNHTVTALKTGEVRKYVGSRSLEFLDFNKYFAYITKGDTLRLESHDGKRIFEQSQSVDFQSLADGRFLLIGDKNFYAQEPKNLRILDLADFEVHVFPQVTTLSIAPDKSSIFLYSEKDAVTSLSIYRPLQGTVQPLEVPDGYAPTKIEWTEDSRSLTFMLQKSGEDQAVDHVGVMTDVNRKDSFRIVEMMQIRGWENLTLTRHSSGYPILSHDKKKLFLLANHIEQEKVEEKHVEIWKSRAKWLYPYRNAGDTKSRPKLGVIDLEHQTFKLVTTPTEGESIRGLQDRYILNLDRTKYQPAYKFGEDHFDMRLVDVTLGKEYLVDTFVKDYGSRLLFAESLGSLIYYNKSHWNLHNLSTQKTIKITENIPNMITECANCNHGLAIGQSDQKFYVFDQFNLWQVDASGGQPKKLTGHDGAGIEYRFAQTYYGNGQRHKILVVDPIEGIYLQAVNRKTGDTGYFRWTAKKGLEQIVFGPMKYQFLQVLPHKKGYLYTREAFDRSPEIIWQPSLNAEGKLIARSNPQQDEYYWGRSEMVQYRTPRGYRSEGRALHGALFYPANYDPSKKYPLIVSIYEDNSYTLHEYLNPGVNIFVDFNPTDYTLEGYFVLLPNLLPREASNPGHSMMQNLQAAVDYMKSTGMIDEKRIGLYGHSFGGYESLFAASQSDDFATIIAGAGISDIMTDYFSHRQLLRGPSFYRTEQMQKEMKRNYFEIPELYKANSPFTYIPQIKTPILLWTGKNDVNVGPEQSVQFYLGMLRLDKECTMLMYPDEDHVLAKQENIEDLDMRMKQWFNHYLQEGPREKWMVPEE